MSAVLASSSAFISLKEKKERILHFDDQFKDLRPNWSAVNMEHPLYYQYRLGDEKDDDMGF